MSSLKTAQDGPMNQGSFNANASHAGNGGMALPLFSPRSARTAVGIMHSHKPSDTHASGQAPGQGTSIYPNYYPGEDHHPHEHSEGSQPTPFSYHQRLQPPSSALSHRELRDHTIATVPQDHIPAIATATQLFKSVPPMSLPLQTPMPTANRGAPGADRNRVRSYMHK